MLSRIDGLVDQIEAGRSLLDRGLSQPARWRGFLRREFAGPRHADLRARVASAFDAFIPLAADCRLTFDASLLKAVHDRAVGGSEYRSTGVVIRRDGRPSLRPPASTAVPDLVDRALERAADRLEPPALAAARLHLEMLLIHPFSDGNGRAVRLLSSLLLIRAGYRSTLFTTVEQHFAETPGKYGRAFVDLANRGGDDHWSWLVAALEAMAAHSRLAFLYRTGEWSPGQDDPKTRRHLEAQLARITEEEQYESLRPPTTLTSDVRSHDF